MALYNENNNVCERMKKNLLLSHNNRGSTLVRPYYCIVILNPFYVFILFIFLNKKNIKLLLAIV